MPALTANEQALLKENGVFFIDNVMPLLAETVFWGIYLVAISLSFFWILSTGIRSRPRAAMLLVAGVLFAMSTLLLALHTYTMMLQAIDSLLAQTTSDQGVHGQGASTDAVLPIIYVQDWIFPLEFLIGDAVVIWRTWALWSRSLAMVVPCTMWLASLGLHVGERILTVTSGALQDPTLTDSLVGQKLARASFSLSIATNAVSTAMIGYKTWKYRRSIKSALGPHATPTVVERMLALLIESGLIYLIIWAIQIIVYFDFEFGPGMIFRDVWNSIAHQAVGLYPTLVIMLVELQRTLWHEMNAPRKLSFGSSTTTTTSGTRSTQVDSRQNGADDELTFADHRHSPVNYGTDECIEMYARDRNDPGT